MVGVAGKEHERVKSRSTLWNLFCIFVAILLFSAATAKVWNVPVIMAQNGLLSNKWLLLAAIGIELASAVLIFALRDRIAWWLIVGLFSVFFVAAGYSLISGAECNCFGFDWLGSRFTLTVDASVVALALSLRSQVRPSGGPPLQLQRVLVLAGAVAVTGMSFAEIRKFRNFSTKKLEYILADDMLGNRWPITDAYHPDLGQLKSGKWLVLILRPDCDHCRELVEKHFKDPTWHGPEERTAVFLAGSDEWSFRFDYVSMEPGSTTIRWYEGEPFVASPLVVQLQEGQVIAALESLTTKAVGD